MHFGFLFFLSSHTLWATEPRIIHVYLTWQTDPCRAVTLNCHSYDTSNTLTMHYGIFPNGDKKYLNACQLSLNQDCHIPDGRKIHQGEVTGLIPGQTYYFILSDEDQVLTKEYFFQTIPENGQITFIEGGDWENTAEAAKLAHVASLYQPMGVFLGGDYGSSILSSKDYKRWDTWLDIYDQKITRDGKLIPLVLAVGNHEVKGGFGKTKADAPFFFHYFKQGSTKESYFKLTFGNQFTLFVLDSGHATSHMGEQKQWLEQNLSETKTPIKIALYHVPLYPSLRFSHKDLLYYCTFGLIDKIKGRNWSKFLYCRESEEGLKHWLPLFDRYRLTAAFEHHDQALKRTKPLRNGSYHPNGTVYLGDGGWGSKIQRYPIQGIVQNHFAQILGKKHFFWKVSVSDDGVDYRAIDIENRVVDHYFQKINQCKK